MIDGPNGAIASLNGLSVARDGTGGLIYLKAVGGVPHVFVSALIGGQFQPPQQVDAALAGASSQPVIAAGNGGVLLIAFINAGQLDVVDRSAGGASYSAPAALAIDASNPSIDMTDFGKGYLAFTVADGAGHDVRTAYYDAGTWALEAPPLNAIPADDAGTGTCSTASPPVCSGGPRVAAAGDGVAIVAWGEGGHIITRRVWGTAPSVVDEQADVPSLSGCGEVSAGEPAVASGGDSSYADVAFQETLSCGGVQQTRVLVNHLRASQYDGVAAADGLSSPAMASAGNPQVAMTEYGAGFVTSDQTDTNNVVAMELGNNGGFGGVLQVNSLSGTSPPFAIPAITGLFSDLIAWQQDPGSTGPAEIRIRFQPRASDLGPEQVVSSPSGGPTDAARGFAAAGDIGGDAAIAWVQGTAASTQIVAERLYQPPAAATPPSSFGYARTAQPVLAWNASSARWGPILYTVTVDGVQAGQTGGDAIRLPGPLGDGRHSWSVTATNPAGLSSTSRVAIVFVDTLAPRLRVVLSGARRAGSALALRLFYRDRPPRGLPSRDASGVATVTIRWGDGTVTHLRPGVHRIVHAYRRPGRYRIRVIVTDRAGNRTTVVRHVKIARTGSSGSTSGSRR